MVLERALDLAGGKGDEEILTSQASGSSAYKTIRPFTMTRVTTS